MQTDGWPQDVKLDNKKITFKHLNVTGKRTGATWTEFSRRRPDFNKANQNQEPRFTTDTDVFNVNMSGKCVAALLCESILINSREK